MFGAKTFILTLVVLSGCVAIVSARSPPDYWRVYEKYSKEANTLKDAEKLMHPEFRNRYPVKSGHEVELNTDYWKTLGSKVVADNLKKEPNTKVAKNVILFLGDGLSVPTTTATRSYLGDPSMNLAYETLPFVGMAKTYCVDRQVADSACTATAYLSGVKTNYQAIGVNANVTDMDCEAAQVEKNRTPSIAKWAMDAGKGAGFVTTTRVTHASPVMFYLNYALKY